MTVRIIMVAMLMLPVADASGGMLRKTSVLVEGQCIAGHSYSVVVKVGSVIDKTIATVKCDEFPTCVEIGAGYNLGMLFLRTAGYPDTPAAPNDEHLKCPPTTQ